MLQKIIDTRPRNDGVQGQEYLVNGKVQWKQRGNRAEHCFATAIAQLLHKCRISE